MKMIVRLRLLGLLGLLCLLLAAATMLPQPTAVRAWSGDTTQNTPICAASGDQRAPQIIPDGSGGAIITWEDPRSGTTNYNIYAQRVNSGGTVQWTTNGVAICTASGDQRFPQIIPDGSGGAIITWYDYRSGPNNDIYAQRVDSEGAVQWAGNGVAICTASGDQYRPQIIPDGSGGAIITWQDHRSGSANPDIYARRVNSLISMPGG